MARGLGNGPAYARRSVLNPAVGRAAPYAWWQSQLKGSGTLVAEAAAGATTVELTSTTDYHVVGTINVDTGNGGDKLESRTITEIGTTGITFTPALDGSHPVGALVTASGNNIPRSRRVARVGWLRCRRPVVIRPGQSRARPVQQLHRGGRWTYRSPQGLIRSEWANEGDRFDLTVEIPANTSATVCVPVTESELQPPPHARFLRSEDGYSVYRVGSGVYTFASAGLAPSE
jgi:hypothetical protein